MSTTDRTLNELGNELDMMRGHVQEARLILRTLTMGWGNLPLDERAVVRVTAEMGRSVHKFEQRLLGMKAEIRSLSHSVHRKGDSSSHGRLGRAKGLVGKVDGELEMLYHEVAALHEHVQNKLNDPGRSGGDAMLATGPVADLLSMLATLLEILYLAHSKKRALARSKAD